MGIVVQHNRQVDCLPDSTVVLDNSGLGRLLEIGQDYDERIGPALLGFFGKLNSQFSAVMARPINDRHAVADNIASQSKQPDSFLPVKCNELAAGSRYHQPIGALMGNKPIPVACCRLLI